jgi:hypothetical protein
VSGHSEKPIMCLRFRDDFACVGSRVNRPGSAFVTTEAGVPPARRSSRWLFLPFAVPPVRCSFRKDQRANHRPRRHSE